MSDESTKAIIKKKVKAHIPKDWLKELRIVYRIGLETIYGIKRTGWINIAIITTMAAILTIFGSLFRTTLSITSFVQELGNVLEISVLQDSAGNSIFKNLMEQNNFVLPEHAKERIDVFLNPESDPRGSGYNIIQSKIAIGSGGLTGMGLLKGNQTQLGFLYPKTTDFIYSVIGEEMGFIVAGAIILLYVYLITKCIYIAKTAKDRAGSLIAIGITGIFLFHVLENIGMVMGLLPITGVPLPFISYGGSSLITNFICIGLLLNISGKRKKTIFVQ